VEQDDWEESALLSLAQWKERRADPAAVGARIGVRLEPADDPAELVPDLHRIQLVAINFPKFADGRGYSSAALLRTRHGYRGELRAVGDVGRDQLFYLKRCGFDAFALAPHRDPHAALASLGDFTERYQGSVDDPLPLFRKRLAAGGWR
jgi:uncharacterized protein (DUF934 family)